jgi:hypothetical protein
MPSEDKTKKTDSDMFLASLDAQIGALQTLRDAYLKAKAFGALGQSTDAIHAPKPPTPYGGDAPVELPTGAFLNMSIPEAIKLYLSAVKRKQTAREIAAALKEGGMESTAANWETTVTGALHRLKTAGSVLRFKDGWSLSEFYPESLRSRLAKEDKPRKARRNKATSPKTKAMASKKTRAIRLTPEPEAEKKAS